MVRARTRGEQVRLADRPGQTQSRPVGLARLGDRWREQTGRGRTITPLPEISGRGGRANAGRDWAGGIPRESGDAVGQGGAAGRADVQGGRAGAMRSVRKTANALARKMITKKANDVS